MIGKTAERHTSKEFVAFLAEVVAQCPARQEIHIIPDNLSAHKTPAVRDFLRAHPNVSLHFTPTYSLWLNQVELWFAKIERDVIARGVFNSVKDLAKKLRRYINACSYRNTRRLARDDWDPPDIHAQGAGKASPWPHGVTLAHRVTSTIRGVRCARRYSA